MTSELSAFAARLREFIASSLPVAADISQRFSNPERINALAREARPDTATVFSLSSPKGGEGVGEEASCFLNSAPLTPALSPLGRGEGVGPASGCAPTHVGAYEEKFNALALELFALQFGHNLTYRQLCEARHLTPLTIAHWAQIPAVPTAAFKEFDLTCLAPAQRTQVFHSSGTTGQQPSRHFHNAESLAAYEASLLHWFPLPTTERGQLLILTPPPAEVPNSSLVHMFETLRRESVAPKTAFVGRIAEDGGWTLDFDASLAALNQSEKPLLVLGTAFSFVHLLDYLTERNVRLQLPPGSHVLETGGYKGRSRALPKSELHTLITKRLGVPQSHIICEYGMSELSSQAYASRSPQFQFPPWARAQIVSPETGREVAEGETGLIRVFDLANVFSVMAIQTEDLSIRRGDGFELHGRAALAESRGCSLMTA